VPAHIHPTPLRFAHEPVSLRGSAHPGSVSSCPPLIETTKCPESLCPFPGVTCSGGTSRPLRGRYPSFIALTDSCARPSSSRLLGSRLVWLVFAGCRQSPAGWWPFPTLSLYVLPWMPGPLPRRLLWCFCPFLPKGLRPSPHHDQVGVLANPRAATSARRYISRLQAFLYVQASKFACHPGRSDRYETAVWPPWRLLPNPGEFVTSLPVGYANCPNRAIDSRGLSPH
jgi:hypothetical protein